METNNIKEPIAEDNLRLVSALCKRFTGRGIEYDDLYGAGCLGLVKAINNFDGSRGLMFSTYAVPVILGEIKRLFRDGGEIKISRSMKELYLRASKEKEKLEKEFLREVSINEIAERLGETKESVAEAFCACRPILSLTVGDEKGETVIDVPEESKEEDISNRILLESAIKKLSVQEQKLIKYRFFEELTQSETASKLNISQVQVSRNEKNVLIKLKKIIEIGA